MRTSPKPFVRVAPDSLPSVGVELYYDVGSTILLSKKPIPQTKKPPVLFPRMLVRRIGNRLVRGNVHRLLYLTLIRKLG